MNTSPRFFRLAALFTLAVLPLLGHAAAPIANTSRQIPEPLKTWESWATWDAVHRYCPTPYSDGSKPICFWPSRLSLQVDKSAGRFDFGVTIYSETWLPLPGGKDVWPLEVKANGTLVPVVEHANVPAVYLTTGTYRLEGIYRWNEMPQSLPLPQEIGILS